MLRVLNGRNSGLSIFLESVRVFDPRRGVAVFILQAAAYLKNNKKEPPNQSIQAGTYMCTCTYLPLHTARGTIFYTHGG